MVWGQNGDPPDPTNSTRAFLATFASLHTLAGVRAFSYVADGDRWKLTEAIFKSSDLVSLFCEVATQPSGSWWLPMSTRAPGGGEWDNSPTSTSPSDPVGNMMPGLVYPTQFLLWIPEQPLAPELGVLTFTGTLEGSFPDEAPPPPEC